MQDNWEEEIVQYMIAANDNVADAMDVINAQLEKIKKATPTNE